MRLFSKFFRQSGEFSDEEIRFQARDFLETLQPLDERDPVEIFTSLIQSPRGILPAFDFGGSHHDHFADTLLAILHRHPAIVNRAPRQLLSADLPTVALFTDDHLTTLSDIKVRLQRTQSDLIYVRMLSEWDDPADPVLDIEVLLEFLHEARTCCIYVNTDWFVARRDFMHEVVAQLPPTLKIRELPNRIAEHSVQREDIDDNQPLLTASQQKVYKHTRR